MKWVDPVPKKSGCLASLPLALAKLPAALFRALLADTKGRA